jgi:hypothetical protein
MVLRASAGVSQPGFEGHFRPDHFPDNFIDARVMTALRH